MNFSQRLKLLRNVNKTTQEDLAKYLGVGRATVAGYETKGTQPSFETLFKIADYFSVSIDYLLGRTEIKEPADNIIKKSELEIVNKIRDLSSESKNELIIYLEFLGYRDLILNSDTQKKDSL